MESFCCSFDIEISSRRAVADGEAVGGQLRLNGRDGRLERAIEAGPSERG